MISVESVEFQENEALSMHSSILVMERSTVQSCLAAPFILLKLLNEIAKSRQHARHKPANVGGTRHVESWKSRGLGNAAVPQAFPIPPPQRPSASVSGVQGRV